MNFALLVQRLTKTGYRSIVSYYLKLIKDSWPKIGLNL
jgi:hypothetical protein